MPQIIVWISVIVRFFSNVQEGLLFVTFNSVEIEFPYVAQAASKLKSSCFSCHCLGLDIDNDAEFST